MSKPYHRNPRQITKRKIARLTDTLARLGDLGGIVHNLETDEIIGGNQRTNVFGEASRVEIVEKYDTPDEQGTVAHGFIVWRGKKYSYRQVRWDEATSAEANLAANIGAGDWNWDTFANQWQPAELMEWGFDADLLKDWKRDTAALDNFLKSEQAEPVDAEPQTDRAAELNEKWQVKTGDFFRIGDHRLLCGDSTNQDDVIRALDNLEVVSCVTDPPYNVGKEFKNDKLSKKEFDEFNKAWVSCLPQNICVFIAFHSPQKFPSLLFAALNAGFEFGRMLWLWKPGTAFGVFPWHGWARRSECIMVFERSAKWPEWVEYHPDMYDHKKGEGATEETVDSETVLHPTVKPLWVVQDIINHTVGDCYEPFAGSGTTLVACQNLQRKCRAIEISPNYVAVCLERMSTAFPELTIERIE